MLSRLLPPAALLALALTLPCVFATELPCQPDLIVAADGSGQFKTVQAALDSIPADNHERIIVLIRNGTYHEKIRINVRDVTLHGESRDGVRLEFPQARDDFQKQPDALGFAVVNIDAGGGDCVLDNLTVENTHGVLGVHAFAIYGRADRTVITDCNIFSQGNDTLSLWKGDTGRYYQARLNVRGSVDFICPRGWCYMADSDIHEVNPGASAAIWHDGSKDRDQKFVLRGCRFDGVDGWRLARHHVDAQFYLLDCTFSTAMRDLAPKRVIYPNNGGTPTEADTKRNAALDPQNRWGERFYYFNCHRGGGNYAWFADNLAMAPGAPKPEEITAKWTFAGTWDPEIGTPPAIKSLTWKGRRATVVFTESVTVKGHPRLVLPGEGVAELVSGSGSDTLQFDARWSMDNTVVMFDLVHGAIIATDAAATLRQASLALPPG
jgi:pectinesterase